MRTILLVVSFSALVYTLGAQAAVATGNVSLGRPYAYLLTVPGEEQPAPGSPGGPPVVSPQPPPAAVLPG